MAERLRRGLQNLLDEFDSRTCLQNYDYDSSRRGAIIVLIILLAQGRLAVGNGLGQQIYGCLRLVGQTETLLAQ